MKTRIVRIGNSRGVRIPKPLIEQAGLGDEVELRVVESGLLAQPARKPRFDLAEAARQLHERGAKAAGNVCRVTSRITRRCIRTNEPPNNALQPRLSTGAAERER